MNEFKQFHDSDKKFNFQTMVFFCEANQNHQLSLYDLLKMSSNAAVEDYNQQGMSRDFLVEHKVAILVSRVSYRFHRMPKENEKIVLKTWEEKPEALQLVRVYSFESMSGEKLITGLGSWIVVNLENRRIIPSKNFTLRTAPELQTELDCLKYGKIAIPEDMTLFDEHVVKYSDLDGNGHTNNARYGAFVADAIPAEFRNVQFTDFRLNYAKEAMLGEKIQIFGKVDNENKKITFVGKTEQGVSFEAELYFN